MSLPANVKSIRDRYVAKYPVPRGPNPSDDTFENICRGWVLGLAEQVRFETGDAKWGVKNAGGGRPQSKDSLTYQGPPLTNYDLLTGVGTGSPWLVADPQGADITGQVFLPVAAINHLGNVSQPPVDDPPTDPVPTYDGAKMAVLVARIEQLGRHLGAW